MSYFSRVEPNPTWPREIAPAQVSEIRAASHRARERCERRERVYVVLVFAAMGVVLFFLGWGRSVLG